MHLYNEWLPPVVADQAAEAEPRRFHLLVSALLDAQKEGDVKATLKFVSPIVSFLNSLTELEIPDVEAAANAALELLTSCPDNLFAQIRWGSVLSKILKKKALRKKLQLTIDWRPLYALLTDVHLRRRHTYEGLALHQVHEQTVLNLVQHARVFFPPGAAQEIWAELSPAFKDLAHNDALEAAGLIALFLPTKSQVGGSDSAQNAPPWKDWVAEWIRLWGAIPNCKYWDTQWGGLVARAIKHVAPEDVDWEPHLPYLFTQFLNAVEVPVGKSQAQSPIDRSAPREISRMFANHSRVEHVASSMVLLYGRYPSVRTKFEAFVDYLEQYYHPSNGGSWTGSLERLLRYLVLSFLKRLAGEKKHSQDPPGAKPRLPALTPELRKAFVTSLMRFIDRAQYSKSPHMVGQAATSAMGLAYAEPTVVLPLAIARFQQAVETVTATHQLESAVTTLALCTRPILLASPPFGSPGADPMELDDVPLGSAHVGQLAAGRAAIADALMHTLPGIDANDPPKTLATLQLYASVLSSVGTIGDPEDGGSGVLPLDWSDWVAEFLRRLLSTLQNLEPSSATTSAAGGTFFMSGGSMFRPMLELLFGRLTVPLYKQALRKITEFVTSTVVPGAEAEVGFLCGAAMYAWPDLAAPALVPPLVEKVLQLLEGTESTGAGGADPGWVKEKGSKKVPALSPALASSISYHLDVLCTLLMFGGPCLVAYKDSLIKLLAAAFDAPAAKVIEAANRVLQSLLSSLVLYYSLDEYRSVPALPDSAGIDAWLSTKGASRPPPEMKPSWHVPTNEEVAFANELLALHLTGALRDLSQIVETGSAGIEKDSLRVVLLRLDGSVRGARACIPDFRPASGPNGAEPLNVVGSAGASIGSETMRDEMATVLHAACGYMKDTRADDTVNMQQLLRVIDSFANYGSIEYSTWAHGRISWISDAASLTEPKFSVLAGGEDAQARQRPYWLLVEQAFLHLTWRASQAHYRPFFPNRPASAPPSLVTLSQDLLQMCLSRYNAVRTSARAPLERILKRYPTLIDSCLPTLSTAMGGSDSNEETAMGACALYATRVFMRRVTQDWSAMASFLFAMLESEKHESVKAQASINEAFVVFALRFSRPNVERGEGPKYSDVLDRINSLLGNESKSSALHWRYTVMANAFLLLLTTHGAALPSPGDENGSGKSPLEHFLRNLSSELPPLRPLSVVALLMLLQGREGSTVQLNPKTLKLTSLKDSGLDMDVDEGEEEVAGVSHQVEKQPASRRAEVSTSGRGVPPGGGHAVLADLVASKGFAEKALRNLALDHNLEEGGSAGAEGLGAAAARMFQQGGASLIKAMGAVAAAKEWPHTKTKDVANRAVSGQAFNPTYAQLFERLAGVCSSEAIAALRTPLEEAVGAVHDRPSQCIAAEAMAGLLHGGGNAVQGAWEKWMEGLLRQALSGALPESQGEWAACLRYIATGTGPSGHGAPHLRAEVIACAAEPVSSTAASGPVAKRLTLLGSILAELTQGGENDPALRFKMALLQELEGNMANPARQVRENVGRLLALLFANLAQPLPPGTPSGDQWASLQAKSVALRQSLTDRAPAAVARVQELSGGEESGANDEAVRWMETVLFFVISAVKSGDAASLSSTIVPLLHPIMAVQEVSDQDFALLAKQALAYLKYLPLPGSSLPGATQEIVAASGAANWHTRAAALVFLQAFAYRHSFLLRGGDLDMLRGAVLRLLADPQLEVRELAAATLTGLLKGDDGSFSASVREQCTAAAKEAHAFSRSSKKKKAAAGTLSSPYDSVPARHGPILGLSACVLSSPYDVPKWLPKVLMTLADSVHEPSPIKTTITKTFGDFKRTHADTWTLHRTEFSEEELDVLADLTSSASYFV